MTELTQQVLLITGGAGYLGRRLIQVASRGNVHATWHQTPLASHTRAIAHQLDLRDRDATRQLVTTLKPKVIIHTAPSSQNAEHVAAIVPAASHISAAAQAVRARLIHLSSDMVFDGNYAPYSDDAACRPLSPYGKAKAEAEQIVAAAVEDAAIVRPSLIFGHDPTDSHTQWLIDSLQQGKPIRLFTDEIRCPLWVDNLAYALLELATLDYVGPLNVAGAQPLSRWKFGRKLLNMLGLKPGNVIMPGNIKTSGLIRPKELILDISQAQRVLRTPLLSVDEAISGIQSRRQPFKLY